MPRLLYLLEPSADPQGARAVEQLQRGLAGRFDIEARSIAPRGGWDGQADALNGSPRYRNTVAALLDLRRNGGQTEMVHAWGDRALRAAAFSSGPKTLVYTPTESFGRSSLRWLRAIESHRDLHVMAPSATFAQMCVEHGLPLERCHVVRPGVDFSRVHSRRDPALRRALGLSDQDVVLLPIGPATVAADHRLAVWAAGILHVLDQKHKVLLWGSGPEARSVDTFARQLRMRDNFRNAQAMLKRPLEFEDLLPAADVLLLSATRPISPGFIPIAMAAALPIVAVVSPTASEMLEDRHTALFAAAPSPRLLAQRITELLADPLMQWHISDRARAEAYEHFSQTRFVQAAGDFYESLLTGRTALAESALPGQSA